MMGKKYSISDITEQIIHLENEHDLIDWQINGIFVYQSVRVKIYSLIQNALLYQHESKNKNRRILNKIINFYDRIILNALYFNPFINISKKDIIIFESSRKYNFNGNYIDIYTKYLVNELKGQGKKIQKIQSSYLFDKLSRDRRKTKHLDFIYLWAKIKSKLIKTAISSEDICKIETIENAIYHLFDLKINLLKIFEDEIKRFNVEYPLFKYFFKKTSPKEIFLVNFCDKAPLIKAAKDNDIVVNEIQHGIMVKEDLIFHFPNSEKGSVAYFPDKFYVWEDYWGNSAAIPISKNNIIKFGNRHLEFVKKKYNYIKKDEKTILIVSQPDLTEQIFKFVLDNIKYLSEYNVIIKLHPGEFSHYTKSKGYHEIKSFDNISFIENNESIYLYMAKSKFCIGVYSAALIEATYFDCQVRLLNLPGVEMMKDYLAKDNIKIVDLKENLLPYLE